MLEFAIATNSSLDSWNMYDCTRYCNIHCEKWGEPFWERYDEGLYFERELSVLQADELSIGGRGCDDTV